MNCVVIWRIQKSFLIHTHASSQAVGSEKTSGRLTRNISKANKNIIECKSVEHIHTHASSQAVGAEKT